VRHRVPSHFNWNLRRTEKGSENKMFVHRSSAAVFYISSAPFIFSELQAICVQDFVGFMLKLTVISV